MEEQQDLLLRVLQEITGLRSELKEETAKLRSELKGMRKAFKKEIVGLRNEMHDEFILTRTETAHRFDRLEETIDILSVKVNENSQSIQDLTQTSA
ncbi:hypothetical protein [Effusibacillus consociatus]|uniref:Uncharacterized protein n=1 Tax=Effusibacillus consociatus TaxID=1117041 RepID=A0ABV9PZK4_9BACL